jgi:ketosteroid isomerase-like protein
MKSGLLTLLFLCSSFILCAQEFADPNLQSLISAERAFSKMAKEKNTRDAFLAFLADDAVTSAPGNGPRIGKKYLEEQQPNDSWLYWEPAYTDIAASGDFGFNTGPWEYRQTRKDEKPVAFGHFVSIWKKDDQGEWKVAVDIGIGHPQAAGKISLTTSALKLKSVLQNTNSKNEIIDLEQKFIKDLAEKGNAAYGTVRSKEARFYRAGNLPYILQSDVDKLLREPASKIIYTLMDGGVSSSSDLAYVYGKASYEIRKDGVKQSRQGSYMRFWKKEDGKTWKLVLDLLTN